MGDCVESLAEVEVDNIHGSPFVYPANQSSKCVQAGGRYRFYSYRAGHALSLTPGAVIEFGLVLPGVWDLK